MTVDELRNAIADLPGHLRVAVRVELESDTAAGFGQSVDEWADIYDARIAPSDQGEALVLRM